MTLPCSPQWNVRSIPMLPAVAQVPLMTVWNEEPGLAAGGGKAHSVDERAIVRIVRHLQAAWNTSDSAAFSSSFAADADFVDILGRHHRGRQTIAAGHREIFDTIYKGSLNRLRVEQIRFLRPDLAIAFLHSRLSSRVGTAVDRPDRMSVRLGDQFSEAHARPTLVLTKAYGVWRIVFFQNTKIAAGLEPARETSQRKRRRRPPPGRTPRRPTS